MTIELTIKTRTPVKKKYKSHSPIIFAVPKELKDKIRKIFELSIKALETNTGNATDWYNATFRTKHALEIAKVIYTDETVKQIQDIVDMLVLKASTHQTDEYWYRFDNDQIDQIKSIHEAMCIMEDDVTRRVQLDAIQITDKYMKQFVTGVQNKTLKQ